jgi:hypothetical protein
MMKKKGRKRSLYLKEYSTERSQDYNIEKNQKIFMNISANKSCLTPQRIKMA